MSTTPVPAGRETGTFGSLICWVEAHGDRPLVIVDSDGRQWTADRATVNYDDLDNPLIEITRWDSDTDHPELRTVIPADLRQVRHAGDWDRMGAWGMSLNVFPASVLTAVVNRLFWEERDCGRKYPTDLSQSLPEGHDPVNLRQRLEDNLTRPLQDRLVEAIVEVVHAAIGEAIVEEVYSVLGFSEPTTERTTQPDLMTWQHTPKE